MSFFGISRNIVGTMKSAHILWRVYLSEAHTGCVQYPRLRSLRSLSLGLLVSVPLRGTTAGHEREALSVLREALNVLCVMCYVEILPTLHAARFT